MGQPMIEYANTQWRKRMTTCIAVPERVLQHNYLYERQELNVSKCQPVADVVEGTNA